MKKKSKIVVDLLGGDTPLPPLVEGVVVLYQELKEKVDLVLFAPEEFSRTLPPSIELIADAEVIGMDEDPLTAVRRKKKSSILQGINLLKQKETDAFISAGNTGAILAAAHLNLPLLPRIERPALLTLLPTQKREMAVLDVGANVSNKADHLVQFASMGVAFQRSRGTSAPKIGLLNIGSEEIKGTAEHREAHQKLQKLYPSDGSRGAVFVGNIEGRETFLGEVDLLVTDGFSGNIFLKTAEGVAAFLLDVLKEHTSKESLASLHKRLHYAEFPGALLCGVDGIVMKCHGNISPQSLARSIQNALDLIGHNLLDKIKKEL